MANTINPRSAKGTRDFSPGDMVLRNFIMNTVRSNFEKFGFLQIETPAVENLETLTGKYGDEGDKLIFKILNSGDYLKGIDNALLKEENADKLTPLLCEKALRYDLTVPFARYVAQHRNDIAFPFKRYQIQPVWRADRPQKGRYREFYQCDADIIGSKSIMLEAELISLVGHVFDALKIKATVKINSRKILQGFCEFNGIQDRFVAFTVLLDKLDKKPWDLIKSDFEALNFSKTVIANIELLIAYSGRKLSSETLESLDKDLKLSDIGKEGISELKEICDYLSHLDLKGISVLVDLSLARGLNYYTGTIIEVVANDVEMGSICGGGRYDDLTSMFGLPGISGIGISFGIDRIFDVLKDRNTASEKGELALKVICLNFGKSEAKSALKIVQSLRNAGVIAEVYPDDNKISKQLKYADQLKASHVIMLGKDEIEKGICAIKSLQTGDQVEVTQKEIIDYFVKLK